MRPDLERRYEDKGVTPPCTTARCENCGWEGNVDEMIDRDDFYYCSEQCITEHDYGLEIGSLER